MYRLFLTLSDYGVGVSSVRSGQRLLPVTNVASWQKHSRLFANLLLSESAIISNLFTAENEQRRTEKFVHDNIVFVGLLLSESAVYCQTKTKKISERNRRLSKVQCGEIVFPNFAGLLPLSCWLKVLSYRNLFVDENVKTRNRSMLHEIFAEPPVCVNVLIS